MGGSGSGGSIIGGSEAEGSMMGGSGAGGSMIGGSGAGGSMMGGSGAGGSMMGGQSSGSSMIGGSSSGGSGAGSSSDATSGASSGASPGASAGGSSGGSGSDDEVVTRVKGYIDANTCNTITFSDYSDTVCGDNAVSYYKEFTYNNKRVIVSNNIPDHPAENDQLQTNPNVRCPGWQFIQLPIDPSKGSSATSTGLGTIGLAITGGVFFNDLSNPDGSLALPNEGPSLDSCLGHSAPAGGGGAGGAPGGGARPPPPGRRYKRQGTPTAGRYHYHANLNCTNAGSATGANDPDQCLLIGYYQDGVPVYGFCKDNNGMMMTSCYKTSAALTTVVTVSGTYESASTNSDYTYTPDASCNLDEASGAVHPTTGKYSYFMTTGYPWTPIKFFGDQGSGASFCGAD